MYFSTLPLSNIHRQLLRVDTGTVLAMAQFFPRKTKRIRVNNESARGRMWGIVCPSDVSVVVCLQKCMRMCVCVSACESVCGYVAST